MAASPRMMVYAGLAVVGLLATWTFNLRFMEESGGSFSAVEFVRAGYANSASSSLSNDLLVGCASMDRTECVNANWYAVGLEDGARGQPLERLGAHRRACAEYGVSPDAERYAAGRNEGLKSFCTYERGFAEGRSGHTNAGVCPATLAGGFQSGYQRGRELFLSEATVKSHLVHIFGKLGVSSRTAAVSEARNRGYIR